MPVTTKSPITRDAYSVDEIARKGIIGRSKIYDEIEAGNLRAVKAGRCTKILAAEWERYIAALPAYQPRRAAA
jgi:excisionase family DNA binding protein